MKKSIWLSYLAYIFYFLDTSYKIKRSPELWKEPIFENRWLSFLGNMFLSFFISTIPIIAVNTILNTWPSLTNVLYVVNCVAAYLIGVYWTYRLLKWREKAMKQQV